MENITKTFLYPVSMKIESKEQECYLAGKLLEIGYVDNDLRVSAPRIIYTNAGGESSYFSSAMSLKRSYQIDYNRYLIEDFNPELFLALASQTKEDAKGNWYVYTGNNYYTFTHGRLYQLKEPHLTSLCAFINDEGEQDGWGGIEGINKAMFRKATKEEIITHFTQNNTQKQEIMKTQQISRDNLKELYDVVCSDWKEVIKEHLSTQSFSDKISVKEEVINEAYKEANKDQKTLLEKFFKIETPKSIIDRINTFQDILTISGNTISDIIPWGNHGNKHNKISQNALAKIQLITEVYNEGEILDWKNTNVPKYTVYKNVLGGRLWVDGYCGICLCPAGFYFVSREKAEDAMKKFPEIFEDFFGI